jgi:hypothetical protein
VAHCDAAIDDAKVFAFVRRHCWACHATDGIAGHDFPDLVALRAAPVVDMVGSCQMPPDGSPLGEADRAMLVDWASCKQ